MSGRKNDSDSIRTLDELGKVLVRAACGSDADAASAVGGDAYARLRARIIAKERDQAEPWTSWFAFLTIARQAIPAMAILAAITVSAFMLRGDDSGASTRMTALPGFELDEERQAPVSACSISTRSECAVSNEEVLATMIENGSGGLPK
jgi:hypothetical protein